MPCIISAKVTNNGSTCLLLYLDGTQQERPNTAPCPHTLPGNTNGCEAAGEPYQTLPKPPSGLTSLLSGTNLLLFLSILHPPGPRIHQPGPVCHNLSSFHRCDRRVSLINHFQKHISGLTSLLLGTNLLRVLSAAHPPGFT